MMQKVWLIVPSLLRLHLELIWCLSKSFIQRLWDLFDLKLFINEKWWNKNAFVTLLISYSVWVGPKHRLNDCFLPKSTLVHHILSRNPSLGSSPKLPSRKTFLIYQTFESLWPKFHQNSDIFQGERSDAKIGGVSIKISCEIRSGNLSGVFAHLEKHGLCVWRRGRHPACEETNMLEPDKMKIFFESSLTRRWKSPLLSSLLPMVRLTKLISCYDDT